MISQREPSVVDSAPAEERYDAFVSYARNDAAFVLELKEALAQRGHTCWVDTEYIPGGADWEARIKREILRCRAFIYVITEASLRSTACQAELRQAQDLNKKIIPVRRDAGDADALPAELQRREWIDLRHDDDFTPGLERLVQAMRVDVDWRDRLTAVAERADLWAEGSGDLLHGRDLKQAEALLIEQAQHRQRLTESQLEYVARSVQARRRRMYVRQVAILAAVLATGGAAAVALVQRQQALTQKHAALVAARTSQSELLASQAVSNSDLQTSSLLAAEAFRLTPTAAARSAVATVAQDRTRSSPLTTGVTSFKSVAFSPDGRLIASADDDGSVRLWDAASHQLVATARPAQSDVAQQVVFAPTGGQVAFAVNHNAVTLWNSETHKTLRTISVPGVNAVAFSPSGGLFAAAKSNGTVDFWDAASHRALGSLHRPQAGKPAAITGIAFSPGGNQLAVADANGVLQAWDHVRRTRGGVFATARSPFVPQEGRVSLSAFKSIAMSPDGRVLVSGDAVGALRFWDFDTGREIGGAIYNGSAGAITAVSISPDDQILAAGDHGGAIRLYSLASRRQLGATLNTDFDQINGLAYSPDGTTLASASDDGTLRLWNNPPAEQFRPPLRDAGGGGDIAFNRDGSRLVSDVSARVWSTRSWRSFVPRPDTSSPVVGAVPSPRGQELALSYNDGSVRLWSFSRALQDGGPLDDHTGSDHSVVFNRDGTLLASAGYDDVRIWGVSSHRQIGKPLVVSSDGSRVSLSFASNSAVAFSPTGDTLAVAYDDDTVRLWDVATHRVVTTFSQRNLSAFAYSPNGATMAIASTDGAVRFWNLKTRRPVGGDITFASASGTVGIESVAFSPDGSVVATGDDNRAVRFWSVSARQEVGAPLYGGDSVMSVVFSPDGHWLASSEHNGTVRIWAVPATGTYLKQLCSHVSRPDAARVVHGIDPFVTYENPC